MIPKSAEEKAFLETLTPEEREIAEGIAESVNALTAGIEKGQLECMSCQKQVRIDRDADGYGWSATCLCGWQAVGRNGLQKH